MKIFYLPIFEPGTHHATALANKHGLRSALIAAGHDVIELDYLAIPVENLRAEIDGYLASFRPDLFLTQLHGADRISADHAAAIRSQYPTMQWVNWSGDSWLHSLTAEPMLEIIRHFTLQLVAAPDVLPIYAEKGIRAEFWQIAYEPPVRELPDVPEYDIVFLGNAYNERRKALMEMLRSLPYKVGIYGDWEHADGNCVYDFAYGEALYKKAKIAISDNAYADQQNYISNRPIQILMAGGALLLHQHVDKMIKLSHGLLAGQHYIEWNDLLDLESLIEYHFRDSNQKWMPSQMRYVAECGQLHAKHFHTYEARVKQLMDWLHVD